jgi:pseudouridine synthase
MTSTGEFADPSRGIRLHKALAEAGVASRRACERLVAEGAVEVNGIPVTESPAWVDPARDRITVHGRRVKAAPAHVYVMLFKPRGVVCTSGAGEGRRRAIDLVKHPSKARLFAVGRLDIDSSGLLLLTNDGELANRLTHPRYHLPKVYEVTVKGELTDKEVQRLARGLYLGDAPGRGGSRTGGRTGRSRLQLVRRDRNRTRLRMELREGRNRQIRRMMARVGHPVRRLRRVQVGPLKLKGLRVGEWRLLTSNELTTVRTGGKHSERSESCVVPIERFVPPQDQHARVGRLRRPPCAWHPTHVGSAGSCDSGSSSLNSTAMSLSRSSCLTTIRRSRTSSSMARNSPSRCRRSCPSNISWSDSRPSARRSRSSRSSW